jgi:hypothetical protein
MAQHPKKEQRRAKRRCKNSSYDKCDFSRLHIKLTTDGRFPKMMVVFWFQFLVVESQMLPEKDGA